MSTRTYDPAKVAQSFAGQLISGYAPGTMITIERNEDAFSLTVGADGEAARTRNNNRSGTVRFTLMQSSPTNDVLSAAAAADELTGLGQGSYYCQDLNGTTVAKGASAWVQKMPAAEFAAELGTREWTIAVPQLDLWIGGNFAP